MHFCYLNRVEVWWVLITDLIENKSQPLTSQYLTSKKLLCSYPQDDMSARDKALGRNRARLLRKAEEKRRNDDPYYCGLSARVPQFAHKKAATRERAQSRDVVK